jgi:hypothetical protein
MTSPDPHPDDAQQTGQQPPLVDPSGLSFKIAQKLAEPGGQVPPPRLSIAHLFLWTTLTAVIMALGRSVFLRDISEFESAGMRPFRIVHWYLLSALYGLISSGFVVVVGRKWRSPHVRLDPGERLLIVRAISFLVQMTAYAMMDLMLGTEGRTIEMYAVIQAVGSSTDFLLAAWAVLTTGPHSAWRWFFAAGGLAAAVNLAFVASADVFTWASWTSVVFYLTAAVECLLLVLAIRGDRADSLARNWLHWLGVITFILSVVFFVGWGILWPLFAGPNA